MPRSSLPHKGLPIIVLILTLSWVTAQCPWPREVSDLTSSCVCALNPENDLSIQCTAVNFTLLMTVLHQQAVELPIDLLYVNNSRISVLNDLTFHGLLIQNIQFSSCGIFNISDGAFEGLEETLRNLNLQDNRMTQVPTLALSRLRNLALLDLSANKLTNIPDDAFMGLPLATLKLADNELTLNDDSFSGLSKTLKNVNLKGCKLRSIPKALSSLQSVAFLDLAQNQIRILEPGSLYALHALTALNLERNLLQDLIPSSFAGVNDTLSSLSLLNNLITDFPKEALNSLTELRVLDIGFNLMTDVPTDAFHALKSLTLLALDGNPLPTVSVKPFLHLNETLRGLSVGGRFLTCDCSVSWISKWIVDFDLQVTSRERNPQFCGQPPQLRDRSFQEILPEDYSCNSSLLKLQLAADADEITAEEVVTQLPETTMQTLLPTRRTTKFKSTTTSLPETKLNSNPSSKDAIGTGGTSDITKGTPSPATSSPRPPALLSRPRERPPTPISRPNLILRPEQDDFAGPHAQGPFTEEVIVQDAYRKDSSVIIQWDSEVSNILGFRVVYRLFGDKQFKLGPPLAASEREFKIKNVPTQECIVVCVVSLEDVNVNPDNVPYLQCREIRTESSSTTHMDTIIIAASAAICGTVIIAVIVFICCNRSRGRGEKDGLPTILSNSAPLASLGTLGNFGGHKDWDTLSMYSQRSIPRARMYHMDKGSVNGGFIPDDARSHVSLASTKPVPRTRSLADGQSQRSYSALSARHLGRAPSFNVPLSISRQDLHMSRNSLGGSQFSPAGFGLGIHSTGVGMTSTGMGVNAGGLSRATSQRSRRARSKSRERSDSRLSRAGSTHSLTGYDSDGWTDHDMDIYMARNPTRGGLVKL